MVKSGRLVLQGFLLLIAAYLLAATGIPVFSDLTSAGAPKVGSAVPVSNGPLSATLSPCLETSATTAVVRLELTGYDPRAQTFSVTASLCVPPNMLQQVRAVGGHHDQAILSSRSNTMMGGGPALRARPAFSRVPITVGYIQYPPQASFEAGGNITASSVLRTSFGDVANHRAVAGDHLVSGGYVPLGRLVLPAQSASDRYPLDWYAALGNISASFSGSQIAIPHSYGIIPVRVIVVQDADVSPLVVRAGTGPPGPLGGIMLELVRSGQTKRFVGVVLIIPVILVGLLAIVLFVRPSASGRNRLGSDAFVGITAALLAILPIRAVLVPSDLQTLTLVDYVLGLEMALLVALTCIGVVWNLRFRPEPEGEASGNAQMEDTPSPASGS